MKVKSIVINTDEGEIELGIDFPVRMSQYAGTRDKIDEATGVLIKELNGVRSFILISGPLNIIEEGMGIMDEFITSMINT